MAGRDPVYKGEYLHKSSSDAQPCASYRRFLFTEQALSRHAHISMQP
jgi:hypothetical protein